MVDPCKVRGLAESHLRRLASMRPKRRRQSEKALTAVLPIATNLPKLDKASVGWPQVVESVNPTSDGIATLPSCNPQQPCGYSGPVRLQRA